MIAVIAGRNVLSQVEAVVSPDRIAFSQAGPFDSQEMAKVFEAVARTYVDILIIDGDMGAIADIVNGVRFYRAKREKTRIILIAVGRQPGDPLVTALVHRGIYDILAPESLESVPDVLKEALDRPPAGYAAALRWDVDLGESRKQSRVKHGDMVLSRERMVEIYRDRIVGTVTIGVGGASPGVGCTHTAMILAYFLARRKYSVAFLELSESGGLAMMANVVQCSEGKMEGSFHYRGIDFYPCQDDPDEHFGIDKVLRMGYQYVVLDLGAIKVIGDDGLWRRRDGLELSRATLPIFVLSASPWRWSDLRPYLDEEESTMWNWVVTGGDQTFFSQLETFLKDQAGLYLLTLLSDPFKVTETMDEFLTSLLKKVLPQANNRPGWFRRLISR